MNPNRLRNSRMRDLMTTPVMCISTGFDLFQINDLMLEHNFRRLPVVKDNKIVGIITQTDVARGLYDFIQGHKDYDCEARLAADEPSYCTKKTNNLIVCEKIVEKAETTEIKKQAKPVKK
jgi:signal-transduction protein with cAMP-binding, CBS, and nucleotidyltransferase domain